MSASDDEIARCIALAIGAAGPADNVNAWKGRINAAIPHVAAAMGEGSNQWRLARAVLDSDRFVCTYLGYDYEESSTRCVVRLETRVSTDYPDGVEPIRTERTDSTIGRRQREMLDALSPGDRLAVWKYMEVRADNPGRSVRLLAHFEKIGSGPNVTTSPEAVVTRDRSGSPPVAPLHQGAEPPVPADLMDPERAAVDEAFSQLTSKGKVAVAQRCRVLGIHNFMHPTTAEVDAVLAAIGVELAKQ